MEIHGKRLKMAPVASERVVQETEYVLRGSYLRFERFLRLLSIITQENPENRLKRLPGPQKGVLCCKHKK